MTDPHDPPPEPPDVGSVGEEAAKLLGALSGWAQESGEAGAGLGATLGGLAGQAAERLGEVSEHLATGAAECTYCPVCRTVHAIRGTSPEVRAHLATAASSFLQAVAGVLATVPPAPGTPASSTPGRDFERIDLDTDGDDHDDD
ncbi:MAG: hypothetical protein JWN84_2841 [Nocardioides sp.]|nr:hypothetical protein [Nocardioides sp.]